MFPAGAKKPLTLNSIIYQMNVTVLVYFISILNRMSIFINLQYNL